eukprot:RCo035755
MAATAIVDGAPAEREGALESLQQSRPRDLSPCCPSPATVRGLRATVEQCVQVLGPTLFLLRILVHPQPSPLTTATASSSSSEEDKEKVSPDPTPVRPSRRFLLSFRLSGVQAPDDGTADPFFRWDSAEGLYSWLRPTAAVASEAVAAAGAAQLPKEVAELWLDLHYAHQSFDICGDLYRVVSSSGGSERAESLAHTLVSRGLARVVGLHPNLPELAEAQRTAVACGAGFWSLLKAAKEGVFRGRVVQVLSGSSFLVDPDLLTLREAPCCTRSLLQGGDPAGLPTAA